MTNELPFSRPVRVEPLPKDGLNQTIAADAAERAALAALNGLPAIAKLTANLTLRRAGRDVVRVTGQVLAEVTQTCIVSLEPFAVMIDEPVDVRFAAPREAEAGRRKQSAAGEADAAHFEAEDPPDPIVDGKIDLGTLAAEFMALALDPYPRKPGAVFEPSDKDAPNDSPFGALADLDKTKR
jgi:uncharacterized metal-binding protein YceD (DUF177 family)